MPTPIDITGGTLPITCYPGTPNELWAVMWPTLVATLNENFPGIFVGPTAPGPDMQDRLWFNTTNGQWYQFISGSWTQIPTDRQFLSFFINYYAVDSGAANAIAIAFPDRPLDAYSAGLVFWVKVAASNNGITTVNVDGIGPVTAKKFTYIGLTDLVPGDLIAGGVYAFIHDGTQFILANPTPSQPYKSAIFTDPNLLSTYWPAGQQDVSFAHNFAVVPSLVVWTLVCVVAQSGFSIGDEIDIHDVWVEQANDFEPFVSSWYNVSVCAAGMTPREGSEDIVVNKNGQNPEPIIVPANWRLRCRAYAL